MAVDNFHLIRPLLTFESEDDFYFLQIIQRKKDGYKGSVKGTNNSARLVRSFYISNIDYFDAIEDEVKTLAEDFGARAGINLNKRSRKNVAFHTLKKITDQIMNGDYWNIPNAYNTMCGKHSQSKDKMWIVDIDEPETEMRPIIDLINNLQPEGEKYVTTIPSKNGYHIITTPFNIKDFSDHYPDIDIHKNNPTNLYIPE